MPPKKGGRVFRPMQRVYAKMPGYSPWPAFVVPDKDIPQDVAIAKPKKGSPYCVIFIPDGDYYWINDKGLDDLSDEKLKAALADISVDVKRKMKNLKGVVRGKTTQIKSAIAAADGLTYDGFIDHLASFNEQPDEEEEEEEEEDQDGQEQEELEEEEEQDGIKREDEGDLEEPQEEEDEEDEEEDTSRYNKRAKSNSRKIKVKPRNMKSDDEADFGDISDESIETKKTSKNGKNLSTSGSIGNGRKRSVDQVESASANSRDRKRKPLPVPAKSKQRSGKGGNGSGSTSDEERPLKKERSSLITATTEKPVLTFQEKQKQLWLCRVKLQRTLIQRNSPSSPQDAIRLKPPTADELSTARLILYRLSDFPIDKQLLRKTKIHKVLKTIMRDNTLQYNESFKLHERCEEVLNKWNGLIEELRNEKVDEHKRNHSKEYLDNGDTPGPTTTNNNGNKSEISRKLVHQDDSEVSGLEQSISELEQSKRAELSTDDI